MNSTIKTRLLLILFILSITLFPLFSQSFDYIKGKVIDSKTSGRLSFAAVGLKNNHIGVFANDDGDFKIAQDPRFISDSLVISCIGYKRKAIAFKDLKVSEINDIFLEPDIYRLDEVTVIALRKKLYPKSIIEKAIKNIKRNYSQKPFGYVSYYRDYQKQNDDYINLDEAIVQTSDNGFKKESVLNTYSLLDFKQNRDFRRMNISPFYDTASSSYFYNKNKFIKSATLHNQGGNELFILMIHDAIRNFKTSSFSFVNVFSRDFVLNHTFSEITPVYTDNLILYKINFRANRRLTGDSLIVDGEIYIQPEDYSIHKLDYSGAYLIKGKERKEMFNIRIEYGYENTLDSLMCLKYISFNNIFNVVDTTDNTYFRILESYYYDSSISPLFIEFNNEIDAESARDNSNYTIMVNGKKAKIKNIDVGEKRIIVTLENEKKVPDKHQDVKSDNNRYSVSVQNIKDINGRVLNERKFIEFYQYRELFVQEYINSSQINDSCRILDKPLFQNCISRNLTDKKYWMNTPINYNTDK
jgi:hypothetical protein